MKAKEGARPASLVIGLEAEFSVFVDDVHRKPEQIFKTPQAMIRERMLRREGRSYHLPSGGAVYFDTGVVEVATPIIELDRGCAVRAARSLWEQIEFVRNELDDWEKRAGKKVRLQGFSAHYNVSLPHELQLSDRAGLQLALLLSHILPLPVMLLAANRKSTGVGVRPRGNRIEITSDFTTDPELMIAAASLIFGIVGTVALSPDYSLDWLRRRRIPVIEGFRPRKHTSRKGWLARLDCYPENPFAGDPNEAFWKLTDGRQVSLREAAGEVARKFATSIRRYTDREAFKHVFAVLDGRARSLLDFEERPWRYENVGRSINWDRRRKRTLPRSAYEKVIHRIITGEPLRLDGKTYLAERMGWYEIVFRESGSRRRRKFNLDDLARYFAKPAGRRRKKGSS